MSNLITEKEFYIIISLASLANLERIDPLSKSESTRSYRSSLFQKYSEEDIYKAAGKVRDMYWGRDEVSLHFITATEPEWDNKNRFWRCPSCKRRIHEYHGFCKHCGKKVDWIPLMKKRKKEAEIRGRKDRKKARSCKE